MVLLGVCEIFARFSRNFAGNRSSAQMDETCHSTWGYNIGSSQDFLDVTKRVLTSFLTSFKHVVRYLHVSVLQIWPFTTGYNVIAHHWSRSSFIPQTFESVPLLPSLQVPQSVKLV
jgi:hypothetical protein